MNVEKQLIFSHSCAWVTQFNDEPILETKNFKKPLTPLQKAQLEVFGSLWVLFAQVEEHFSLDTHQYCFLFAPLVFRRSQISIVPAIRFKLIGRAQVEKYLKVSEVRILR